MDTFTKEDWDAIQKLIQQGSVPKAGTDCRIWINGCATNGTPRLHYDSKILNVCKLLLWEEFKDSVQRTTTTCGERKCVTKSHCANRKDEKYEVEAVMKKLEVNSHTDEKTQCRVWDGRVNVEGYGLIPFRSKDWRVHRLAYYLKRGDIPTGLQVRHDSEGKQKCTSKTCWNMDHLSVGTALDQVADRRLVGTVAIGEACAMATTSEATALAIKHNADRDTVADRAKEFGVSKAVVNAIDAGHTWAHLPNKDGQVDTSQHDAFLQKKRVNRKRVREEDSPFTKEQYNRAWRQIQKRAKITACPAEMKLVQPCLILPKVDQAGYGLVGMDYVTRRAHVVSAELHHNNCVKIPTGPVVRHLCSNRACAEPSHLEIGTHRENTLDWVKMVCASDVGHPSLKLNPDKVKRMRLCLASDASQSEIAKEFGVTQAMVSNIKNKNSWEWVLDGASVDVPTLM